MPVWLTACLIGFVVGSLAEYWGHRAMHTVLLKKKHAEHHRDNDGQGWFWEFVDYVVGAGFLLPVGFIHSWEAGWGFAAGGLSYAAFAAYSHQLQHEFPELCFWMIRPCHAIHHDNHMWKTNFGIGIDVWDRVFGTYQKVPWQRPDRPFSLLRMFRIKWI
ncbi:MAG: sterol desaturase family protein [Gemmataceae bacterium]|nr:sterol desaturase family protein [Gemmataceae bacterium]MCI0737791.1 sterol desaturase family protein [Gemmataceae bacterium]